MKKKEDIRESTVAIMQSACFAKTGQIRELIIPEYKKAQYRKKEQNYCEAIKNPNCMCGVLFIIKNVFYSYRSQKKKNV